MSHIMSGEWKQGEVGDCMPVTLGSTPVRGGQLATGPRTCSVFCMWCPAQCWQAVKCAAERNRDRPRASLFRRLHCPGCDSSVKCSPHLPLRTHFHRGRGVWQPKQRTFLLLPAPPHSLVRDMEQAKSSRAGPCAGPMTREKGDGRLLREGTPARA